VAVEAAVVVVVVVLLLLRVGGCGKPGCKAEEGSLYFVCSTASPCRCWCCVTLAVCLAGESSCASCAVGVVVSKTSCVPMAGVVNVEGQQGWRVVPVMYAPPSSVPVCVCMCVCISVCACVYV